jgi:hypothetical protein
MLFQDAFRTPHDRCPTEAEDARGSLYFGMRVQKVIGKPSTIVFVNCCVRKWCYHCAAQGCEWGQQVHNPSSTMVTGTA